MCYIRVVLFRVIAECHISCLSSAELTDERWGEILYTTLFLDRFAVFCTRILILMQLYRINVKSDKQPEFWTKKRKSIYTPDKLQCNVLHHVINLLQYPTLKTHKPHQQPVINTHLKMHTANFSLSNMRTLRPNCKNTLRKIKTLLKLKLSLQSLKHDSWSASKEQKICKYNLYALKCNCTILQCKSLQTISGSRCSVWGAHSDQQRIYRLCMNDSFWQYYRLHQFNFTVHSVVRWINTETDCGGAEISKIHVGNFYSWRSADMIPVWVALLLSAGCMLKPP